MLGSRFNFEGRQTRGTNATDRNIRPVRHRNVRSCLRCQCPRLFYQHRHSEFRCAGTSSNGCNADYMLLDGAGTQRYFNVPETWNGSQCSGATTYAVDSSGYRFYQSPWPGTSAYTSMYAPDGTLEAGGTTFDTIDAAK